MWTEPETLTGKPSAPSGLLPKWPKPILTLEVEYSTPWRKLCFESDYLVRTRRRAWSYRKIPRVFVHCMQVSRGEKLATKLSADSPGLLAPSAQPHRCKLGVPRTSNARSCLSMSNGYLDHGHHRRSCNGSVLRRVLRARTWMRASHPAKLASSKRTTYAMSLNQAHKFPRCLARAPSLKPNYL